MEASQDSHPNRALEFRVDSFVDDTLVSFWKTYVTKNTVAQQGFASYLKDQLYAWP